jgi:hypothetical protein
MPLLITIHEDDVWEPVAGMPNRWALRHPFGPRPYGRTTGYQAQYQLRLESDQWSLWEVRPEARDQLVACFTSPDTPEPEAKLWALRELVDLARQRIELYAGQMQRLSSMAQTLPHLRVVDPA